MSCTWTVLLETTNTKPRKMDTAAESINTAFFGLALQFLEASAAAWPEDTLLPIAVSEFKKVDPARAIELFETHFGRYVEGLARKEETVLFQAANEPSVAALAIHAKFTGANDSTKDTMWSYITQLCRFSSTKAFYTAIPAPVLAVVNETAQDVKAKIDAGQLDLSSLNPMELGQQVMSKFDPAQMQTMMNQILGNPKTMNRILAGVSGSDLSGGGGLDLGSIMKLLGPR